MNKKWFLIIGVLVILFALIAIGNGKTQGAYYAVISDVNQESIETAQCPRCQEKAFDKADNPLGRYFVIDFGISTRIQSPAIPMGTGCNNNSIPAVNEGISLPIQVYYCAACGFLKGKLTSISIPLNFFGKDKK